MSTIDIVLKVSERCNLSCKYCYFFEQDYNPYSESSSQMNTRVIDATSSFISNMCHSNLYKKINVGLHGGEPLLLKKEKMIHLLDSIRKKTSQSNKISISIQTNGVNLDPDWIEIFTNFNVNIGVSIDGPKIVNNLNRIYPNGEGTFDDVMKGIRLIQKSSKLNKKFGILCVANPNFNGADLINFCVTDLNIHSFNILLPRISYDDKKSIDLDKWIKYFTEIIDHWLFKVGPSNINIGFLSGFLFSLVSKKGSEKIQTHRSCLHNIVTISSDGYILFDDNLFSIDKNFSEKKYSVFDHNLEQFKNSPLWLKYEKSILSSPDKCLNCKWYNVCGSGIYFNRYSKKNHFNNESVFCELYYYIFEYILEYLISKGSCMEDIKRNIDLPVPVKNESSIGFYSGD